MVESSPTAETPSSLSSQPEVSEAVDDKENELVVEGNVLVTTK